MGFMQIYIIYLIKSQKQPMLQFFQLKLFIQNYYIFLLLYIFIQVIVLFNITKQASLFNQNMRKTHNRGGSNCHKNIDTLYPSSPSAKSSALAQTDNFYFKKRGQSQLIQTKSVNTLLTRQAKLQAMLRQAKLKIKTYKQTMKLLEETISDLDKLNGELINQSKQYSNKLQQFTYKTNEELQEKNEMIQTLKCELKKYQNKNSFSQKRFQMLSSKQIREYAKIQQNLNKKQQQYQKLLKKHQLLKKEKNQQIAYYDKVIEQKEQTIIKMTDFNNQLCMKLLDRKNQSNSISTEQSSMDNFDFDLKNFNLMKDKMFELFQEKEHLIRKIDTQNQRILELEEMYSKNVETIKMLTQQQISFQQDHHKPTISICLNSKNKSETSSSRSQDLDDKTQVQAIKKRDKVSSVYSLSNLLKNQFTFSQHTKTKNNPVFQEDTNKSQENLSQSKETLAKDMLSNDWSDDSIS